MIRFNKEFNKETKTLTNVILSILWLSSSKQLTINVSSVNFFVIDAWVIQIIMMLSKLSLYKQHSLMNEQILLAV